MKHRITTKPRKPLSRGASDLVSELRAQIISGKLAVGDLLPTVREFSAQQGVAHCTAWKALKTLETEGYLEVRPRRGYRVSPRITTTPPTGILAYVMDQRNVIVSGGNALYLRLLEELENGAGHTGTRLTKLIMTPGQEELAIEQLKASNLDGLILDSTNEPLLAWAAETSLPVLLVDDWHPNLRFDSVVQDGFDGGHLAAQHLLGQGCERIAWFGYLDHLHGQARYGGAAAALAAAGRHFSHEENTGFTPKELTDASARLLSGPSRPDGIIAFWRPAYAPLLQAALAANLEIGRDVKIVGWCAQELIEDHYAALFPTATPPPAVTWSIQAMAGTALSRLAERRRTPALPVTSLRVPVALQLFENNS